MRLCRGIQPTASNYRLLTTVLSMTFLNWTMLIGLAGVSIPILIHLLHRRRAKILDWGAMRFLLAALAARKRRIRLEEILLLALRCFLMALLAVAMARPFLPSRSTISWAMVLPALLASAILGAVGVAVWANRRARWLLLIPAVIMLTGAVTLSIIEHYAQQKKWALGDQGMDIAIVIDGSMSMMLDASEGEKLTNFQRAIDEARAVLGACKSADAVSLFLAGNSPRPVVSAPSYDRAQIADALSSLQPTGGSMRVIDALTAAAASLARGANSGKKIVLITDGQSIGWNVADTAQWEFLAGTLKGRSLPEAPEIVCRTLPMPANFTNLGVQNVTFSRRVVGTDRPTSIDVTIMNTGVGEVSPSRVELSINGRRSLTQNIDPISPNTTETVRFEYRFTKVGRHIVTARVVCEDDMPADDAISRVVDVTDRIKVLIVDGAPSIRPLDGAAAFIDIALSPPPAESPGNGANPSRRRVDSGRAGSNLVETKVIEAVHIAAIEDFGEYNVIVLANVSRLPDATARAIGRFVRRGGGLLLAMGDRCEADFYNEWRSPSGDLVIPAKLVKRRTAVVGRPVRLSVGSFLHPALRKIAQYPQSDAADALINAYWQVSADEYDPHVRVGARLETGAPALIERKHGNGIVLQTTMNLHPRDTNLHVLKCFVPLVHEFIYHLSATSMVEGNVPGGVDVTIELPARRPAGGRVLASGSSAIDEPIEVITPDNRRREAAVLSRGEMLRVRFGPADDPGTYRLVLGEANLRRYEASPGDPAGSAFVVVSDPDESRIKTLSEADLNAIGERVPFQHVQSTDELVASIAGGVPGEELWRQLVLAALAVLVAEIFVARWIAIRRRLHAAGSVRFGAEAIDIETFRTRARQLLKSPGELVETGGNGKT